jgi:hypothetical protein
MILSTGAFSADPAKLSRSEARSLGHFVNGAAKKRHRFVAGALKALAGL